MTFENFKPRRGLKEAVEAARSLAEGRSPTPWLALAGGPGTGKTHLAIAVALWRIDQGRPAKYIYVPDFLDELRAGYSEESAMSYQETFARYKEVELLVLDDLGTEKKTPWVYEKLDQLVDWRYLRRMESVFTLNVAANEVPLRIADRLMHARVCRLIDIDAPSYRRRNSQLRVEE